MAPKSGLTNPKKLLKTSTINKNFHLGGEEEESLEEMDGFVENNPQKEEEVLQ